MLCDTFRTVLERANSYKPDADKSIYFWIRRIAINRAIDVHRAYQRTRKLEEALLSESDGEPESEAAPDKGLDRGETKNEVETALSKLNPRYAEALRLRLLQDKDREECAEIMGVTVGNFDVILHRATLAFKKAFQPDDD